MNHRIENVQLLHEQSRQLLTAVSEGKGKELLGNLVAGIENLEKNWIGSDAAVQIQRVVEVHNALVGFVNALGQFGVDSSKVASNYREIQRTNGAALENLEPLNFAAYNTRVVNVNAADTIQINSDAEVGRNHIIAATSNLSDFYNTVKSIYGDMIERNWTQGTGREAAIEAFGTFSSKYPTYQEVLDSVSKNVTTALSNYQM